MKTIEEIAGVLAILCMANEKSNKWIGEMISEFSQEDQDKLFFELIQLRILLVDYTLEKVLGDCGKRSAIMDLFFEHIKGIILTIEGGKEVLEDIFTFPIKFNKYFELLDAAPDGKTLSKKITTLFLESAEVDIHNDPYKHLKITMLLASEVVAFMDTIKNVADPLTEL